MNYDDLGYTVRAIDPATGIVTLVCACDGVAQTIHAAASGWDLSSAAAFTSAAQAYTSAYVAGLRQAAVAIHPAVLALAQG